MIQNKMRVAVAFAVSLFSAMASNANTWVRCDQCTYSQAQELAVALGPDQSVMVHSALSGTAYAFYTQSTVVGDNCYVNRPGDSDVAKLPTQRAVGCQTITTAEAVALEPKQFKYAELVKDVYDQSGGTMKATLRVNGDDIANLPNGGPVTTNPDGVTAYDIANNVYTRIQAADAVFAFWNTQLNVFRKLDTFTQSMFDVQFFGSEVEIDIEVTLSDGSKVKFRIKSVDQEAEFIEAEDPNRAPVMTPDSNLQTYVGDPIFPNDRAAINWLENAVLAGATVVYGSGSRIGEKVSCRWDGEELICKQQH